MKRLLLLSVSLFVSAVLVGAFSFEPISHELSPEGRGASHVFRVVNTNEDRIAVQVSIRPRSIEPSGNELQGKESEDFIIYPRQLLLDPGEQRSVRVRWIGPAELTGELAFRIIAEQLPVEMDDSEPSQGGGIRLTYRYEGSLYVVPQGATPEVELVSVQTLHRDDGRFLQVEVTNSGTRHALLKNLNLALKRSTDDESGILLGPDQLAGANGENMLAESSRIFVVPAPPDLWDGPVYGDMTFEVQ